MWNIPAANNDHGLYFVMDIFVLTNSYISFNDNKKSIKSTKLLRQDKKFFTTLYFLIETKRLKNFFPC